VIALLLWVALAWGQEPDELAIARQQARVTDLAAVVAQARDTEAPRGEVAAAMKAYRVEAEALAELRATRQRAEVDAQQAKRAAAVSALADALAAGKADPGSRVVLADWLGELGTQLGVLQKAVDDARSRPDDPLSRDLALDVAEKAQVVWLAASYDESRARSDARDLRLRAHAIRARASSGMSGGLDEVIEARALEDEAARRSEEATRHQDLADLAATVQRDALAFAGETP